MATPIILPQATSSEDLFRKAMRDPVIAKRVRRDPKFAAKLMAQIESQMRSLTTAPTSDRVAESYRRAPLNTTLGAPIVEGSMSVADAVRKQRDGFLVSDGVQVAGDYVTEIRAEKGGIPAPRMPKVGFPAAQSYKYPSRKMITGAALAATPEAADFTSTRRMLPTASFNPGAFVTTRPVMKQRMVLNEPVPVPSVRDEYPMGSMYAEPQSPSDERRRNLSVLNGLGYNNDVRPTYDGSVSALVRRLPEAVSGLGAVDSNFAKRHSAEFSIYAKTRDPWDIITQGIFYNPDIQANPNLENFLEGLIGWMSKPVTPAQVEKIRAAKCNSFPTEWKDPGLCTIEAAKGLARLALVNTILSDSIDFSGIKMPDGSNLNDWLNANLIGLLPEDWRLTAQALTGGGRIFPIDIRDWGMRRWFISELYAEVFRGAEIKEEWYEALSNELLNRRSGSLLEARNILEKERNKYRPDASPAPKTDLKVADITWDSIPGMARPGGKGGERFPATGMQRTDATAFSSGGADPMILAAGGILAVALIGLGVYFRNK